MLLAGKEKIAILPALKALSIYLYLWVGKPPKIWPSNNQVLKF